MRFFGPNDKNELTVEEQIEVLQAQIDSERYLNGEYLDDPYIVIPMDIDY